MAAEVYNTLTIPWQTKQPTVFNALSMYQKGSIHKATELQPWSLIYRARRLVPRSYSRPSTAFAPRKARSLSSENITRFITLNGVYENIKM